MLRRRQKAFTLIEFVAVVVLLAVLAVVALARYIDLKSDAINTTSATIMAMMEASYSS